MTAQRWWVRLAARWLARIDGVSGQLRLAMLGLTGISTATLTLRQYGHGDLAWPFIGVLSVITILYTYLYTEGGVWNQMARDRQDLSSNYAGPNARISQEMGTRGFIAGIQAETLDDDQIDAIQAELDRSFGELRDGINVDDIDD